MDHQITILMVDDSENDLLLMRAAFSRIGCDVLLQEVRDGDAAIAYLKGDGIHGDRGRFPLPTVMILDLNMPKKSGFEVLTWVNAQPILKRLMIIVLTASMRVKDVERAYDLGANSFLVKPSNLGELADMMGCLYNWVKINDFPRLDEPVAS